MYKYTESIQTKYKYQCLVRIIIREFLQRRSRSRSSVVRSSFRAKCGCFVADGFCVIIVVVGQTDLDRSIFSMPHRPRSSCWYLWAVVENI